MSRIKHLSGSLTVVAFAAIAGCAVDDSSAESDSSEATSSSDVATATQAVGQQACWTSVCNSANSCKDLGAVGQSGEATSPNGSYGTADCLNAYNIEATLTSIDNYGFYQMSVYPYATPTTKSKCESIYIYAKVGWKPRGSNTWVTLTNSDNSEFTYRVKGS